MTYGPTSNTGTCSARAGRRCAGTGVDATARALPRDPAPDPVVVDDWPRRAVGMGAGQEPAVVSAPQAPKDELGAEREQPFVLRLRAVPVAATKSPRKIGGSIAGPAAGMHVSRSGRVQDGRASDDGGHMFGRGFRPAPPGRRPSSTRQMGPGRRHAPAAGPSARAFGTRPRTPRPLRRRPVRGPVARRAPRHGRSMPNSFSQRVVSVMRPVYLLAGRIRPAMTSTEPARAASHPQDCSVAKEVRSTLTRREQRPPLRLTYPHDSPKTPISPWKKSVR